MTIALRHPVSPSHAAIIMARRHRAIAADPAETYAGFAKSGELMRKIDLGYAVLTGIAACPTMRACVPNAPVYTREKRMMDVALTTQEAQVAGHVSDMVRTTPEGVVVEIILPDVQIRMLGLGPRPTPQEAGHHAQARRILNSLLPGIDLEKMGGETRSRVFDIPDSATRTLPLEALSAINVPDVPRLDLGDWQKPLRGAVSYVLKPTSLTTSEVTDRINDHVDIIIMMNVRVHVTLPMEYCIWSQSAESAEDMVPLATWRQFSAQLSYHAGATPREPDERTLHPDSIGKAAARARATYLITGRKLTDDNDICILPNGTWVYAPNVPEASISGMMRECVRDDRVDLAPVRNRHIFTDWVISKMAMSDASGTMSLVDLSGARPPTPTIVAHIATWRVPEELVKSIESLANFLGKPMSLSMLLNLEDLRWENLIDVPYHGDEESVYKTRIDTELFAIGKSLGELYARLASATVPLYRQYEIRPWLALFGPYTASRAHGVRDLGDQIAHNRMAIDTTTPPTLSNMPGVEGVMPHQRRVLNTLSTDPRGAILDVRAGGGKSLAAIHDITGLMARGGVRRPVIIMPRNLLGPFASEVTRFTSGRLRPFIISNRTWRLLIRRVGSHPSALLGLLKRQPANTVFLVDYGWLTNGSQRVSLGADEHDFFPNATMLLELEPDYCCLDESHRAKKLASGRSLAASMITGIAKYRRIMSGTLLHNTAVDLLGQMAQLEPMALGDMGQMIRENKRVQVSQLPELDRVKSAFARTISVPRKEWAHLLPPLIERVHPCEMTPRQRKFYDQIYARLQDDIQKDPKFRRLMKQDSKNAEARITAIFRRKFVPLEQWLNAPDSEYSSTQFGQVFTQLEGVGEEDLRSPKIDVLDEILRGHLEGSMVDLDGGEQEHIPPSGNKAVIFCYNKAVTEHVFKHSRYASKGVLYQAGDDSTLERFKNDPEVVFLYAAVTSMAEGHNLQMADRVVTMQSYWTPGLGEQALARVWRPDVPDKDGVVKYRRDRIFSDQILIQPSVEVAKMARLISKQVSNLLVEEIDSSPALRTIVDRNAGTFENMKPVKMSLDSLKKLQDQQALGVYFDAYRLVKSWERKEFAEARDRVRKEVEARVGRRVSNSELSALSMTAPTNQNTSEFDVPDALQAHGYVPWAEGFTGYNPTGLALVPLEMPRSADDEDEDDADTDADGDEEDDAEQIVTVDPGDPVWTEFGPGIVRTARKGARSVGVLIPGFRDEALRLPRYSVLAARTPTDRAALALLLRSAGKGGLPTLNISSSGELTTTRAEVPVTAVRKAITDADRALRAPPEERTRRAPRGAEQPLAPARPSAPVATRDDLVRERGRISIGDHEAVLLRGKTTGIPAWIVRHQQNPRDRSKPFAQDDKRAAINELLRRHNEAMAQPAAGRPRAIPASDPFVGRPPVAAPTGGDDAQALSIQNKRGRWQVVQGTGMLARVIQTVDTEEEANRAMRRLKRARKSPVAGRPLSLTDVTQVQKKADTRTGVAGTFSGTVCLTTTDGGDRDALLLKSGFDRLAKHVEIRVKNPRAFRALMQLLASKFEIPRLNMDAMQLFADQYQAAKTNVAYLRSRELPQHAAWLKQQRTKAKTDKMIMPWPIVRDGAVYVVINLEQMQSKAQIALRRLTLPVGVVKPVVKPAQMIAMLRSVTGARQLMADLNKRGVEFENRDEILSELRRIKG